jgi:hypothetical protein
MSMMFYQYTVPTDCRLWKDFSMEKVFIAYNPVDGETAFFSIDYDLDITPFNKAEMQYVENRYHQWCLEHPEKATVSCDKSIVLFDREAYESFMRELG